MGTKELIASIATLLTAVVSTSSNAIPVKTPPVKVQIYRADNPQTNDVKCPIRLWGGMSFDLPPSSYMIIYKTKEETISFLVGTTKLIIEGGYKNEKEYEEILDNVYFSCLIVGDHGQAFSSDGVDFEQKKSSFRLIGVR